MTNIFCLSKEKKYHTLYNKSQPLQKYNPQDVFTLQWQSAQYLPLQNPWCCCTEQCQLFSFQEHIRQATVLMLAAVDCYNYINSNSVFITTLFAVSACRYFNKCLSFLRTVRDCIIVKIWNRMSFFYPSFSSSSGPQC